MAELRVSERLEQARRAAGLSPAPSTANTASAPSPGAAGNGSSVAQRLEQAKKETGLITPAKPATADLPVSAPSFLQRAADTAAGAGKQYAAGLGSAIAQSVQAGQSNLLRDEENQYRSKSAQYERMLQENQRQPGKWSQKTLDAKKAELEQLRRMLDVGKQSVEQSGLVQGANKLRERSVQLRQSGQENIDRAKQGLGGLGQFIVDASAAGVQLAGDLAAGAVLPGSGLALMATRAYGSAVEDAADKGASLDQQSAYGIGSAAVAAAAEKIANVAKPFTRAFGGGVLDDAIASVTGRLGQTPAGRVVLSSLSEGGEEFVEAVIQPVLQRATHDRDAQFDLGEALYQAAIGAVLGGVGGGVDVVTSRKGGETPQNTPPNPTAQRTAQEEGVDTARSESPAQGPTDPLAQVLFGHEKTAPKTRAGEYGEAKPQNVDFPTVPIISMSRKGYENADGTLPEAGNALRRDAVKRARERLHLDENEAAYIPASNVMRNGEEYVLKVTKKSLNKMLSPADHSAIALESILVMDNLERIANNGVWKGGEGDRRGRPQVRGFDHLMTTIYIDNEPYVVDMRVQLVQQAPGQNTDNVLYYFTPEEILSVEKAETSSPSGKRRALAAHGGNSVSADNSVSQKPADVKPGTVGAAAAGFETPGSQSVERTSRLAETALPYTAREGQATARTREEYDELFRYMSQTEAQSMQGAQNMLYLLVDGQPTFLLDYDPEGYAAITDSLRLAPAWNGVMTDAAMLIRQELQGRSVNGDVGEDTYVDWLQVMREHATAGGQGVQAWAKWSRTDNAAGQATELEAWEALEESGLSEQERQERFQAIVQFDRRIEAAQTAEDLKQIILEIARQRGTLSGLTGRESRMLTGLASRSLDTMTFDQLRQFAYASSAAMCRDATPANTGEKAKTIQILNMLSNPKTAAKNLAGNTSFYALDAMSMRGAALLDMALSRITGTRSVAMEGSVLSRESRQAIAQAIQMSLAEVTMDVDMGGGNRYEHSRRRTFRAGGTGVMNTNTAADRFAERVLSALERNMGYLMTTTDEAYKGAARSTEAATQRLVDEGKIVNAGRDYAGEQAEQLARYRTFQNDGRAAAAIRLVHDVLNMAGVGDSGRQMGGQTIHSFGLGDLVAPFTRVAGNLAAVGLDYSPVNAVKGTVEILDTVRRRVGGSVDPARQAKAVSDFARGMSGSAIAYGVMVLAKAGLIRRAKDEQDEDVAALNQSEGMVGTQVNIDAAKRWIDGGSQAWQPGDTLIDMSNLEPLNFIVSLGVELADNKTQGVLSTFGDVNTYKDTMWSAAATAGDLPILSSAGDFATDVLVYHNDPVTAGAEMLGKTAISSVTPNALAAFAKGWDSKQRNVYSGDEVADVLLDTIKSRIPGLRESLPTVVNTLGEEKDNPGTLGQRLLNAMLNPIGVNEYSQSEVSREMQRVREQTGETGFYPTTRKPKQLSWKDDEGNVHEVELDYTQRQQFQAACSAVQMSATAAMIGSSGYRSAGEAQQAQLLQRCYDYAYQFAKAGILGDDAADGWVLHARNAQRELGISTAEFLYCYEKYGSGVMGGSGYEKTRRMVDAGLSIEQWAKMQKTVDADGNGSVKKAEVTAYIEANFPREKWGTLFDAYKGGSNWKNPY